jgi:hypothetical protein
MEKSFKQKNFNNFVWTPLGSRVIVYIKIFCFKFTLRCLQPDIVAGLYCLYCLPPVSLTPVANLPPVSTTLAKMVEKFATGVADTGGKLLVLLIPVVHLDLRISPRIFKKI